MTRTRAARTVLLAATVALGAAGCAGTQSTAAPLTRAEPGVQWPVKTREHVDLWLHSFALLMDDTATVPLFARGYRDQLTVIKNSRNILTGLDSSRAALAATLKARPAFEGTQFLALYFGSWEEMRQAFEYFLRAEGDPAKSGNREVQAVIAFLAQQFPRAEGREFARRLIAGVASERERFHHAWWVEQQRERSAALAAADTLWQRRWRPALQRYLNHTQQASGDLILTLALVTVRASARCPVKNRHQASGPAIRLSHPGTLSTPRSFASAILFLVRGTTRARPCPHARQSAPCGLPLPWRACPAWLAVRQPLGGASRPPRISGLPLCSSGCRARQPCGYAR